MWRNNGESYFKTVMFVVAAGLLSACEATLVPDMPGFSTRPGAGGVVVADEPRAVLLTREILNSGGSAADAAVALGFGLSVTLQSRAGLGGGGVCLVYDEATGKAEVLDFSPVPAIGNQSSARWQVSVPSLARGLFALHAKHGRLPWQQVVVPAENTIRFQNIVSRAFASDLLLSSASLVNDPKALDTFMTGGRRMAGEGSQLEQLDLAATIGRLRGRTPGDFYSGAFSRTVEDAAKTSGASLSVEDLSGYAPEWRAAELTREGNVLLYSSQGGDVGTVDAAIESAKASTGFVVADADGNAVACALTMTTPFGNGLMPPGLGFLLSPSPDLATSPLPEAALSIAVERNTRAAVYAAASGGRGAINRMTESARQVLSEEKSLSEALAREADAEQTERPQVNAFHCPRGLLQNLRACVVQADSAGHGFGVIAMGELR